MSPVLEARDYNQRNRRKDKMAGKHVVAKIIRKLFGTALEGTIQENGQHIVQ